MQLADALCFFHSQSYIHRDLKPANVLVHLSKMRVMLIDFGLARTETGVQRTLYPGAHTPGYGAPEQTDSEVGLTAKVDVFAFAMVLLFLLTGSEFGTRTRTFANMEKFLRKCLEPEAVTDLVLKVIEISARCVGGSRVKPEKTSDDPEGRPEMRKVR